MLSYVYFRDTCNDKKEVKMKYFSFFRKPPAGPTLYRSVFQNCLKEATLSLSFFWGGRINSRCIALKEVTLHLERVL